MSLSGQLEREFLAFGLKRFLVRFKRDVTGWVVARYLDSALSWH